MFFFPNRTGVLLWGGGYVMISLQACREVGQLGVYESAVGLLFMVASHQALEPTEFFNKYLQSIQNAD